MGFGWTIPLKEADWKANLKTYWKRFLPEVGKMDEQDFRTEILVIQPQG